MSEKQVVLVKKVNLKKHGNMTGNVVWKKGTIMTESEGCVGAFYNTDVSEIEIELYENEYEELDSSHE